MNEEIAAHHGGFGYADMSSTPQMHFKPRRYSSPFQTPWRGNEQYGAPLFDLSQVNDPAPYMTPNGKFFYPNKIFTPRPLLLSQARKPKINNNGSLPNTIPIDSGLFDDNDVCRNCNNKRLCELGAECVFSHGKKNNFVDNFDHFSVMDEDCFLLDCLPSSFSPPLLSESQQQQQQSSCSPYSGLFNDAKSPAAQQQQLGSSVGSSSTHNTKDSGFGVSSRFQQNDTYEAWSTPAQSSRFIGGEIQNDVVAAEDNPIARSIQTFLVQSFRNEQMKKSEQQYMQKNGGLITGGLPPPHQQQMVPLDLTSPSPLDLSSPPIVSRSRKGSDCLSVGEESCGSYTGSGGGGGGKQSSGGGRWYKTKTEPCTAWHTIGSCRHGENCHFYHDKSEKNTAVIKPRLCKTLSEKGSCPYGDNCRFAHSTDELNPKFKTRFCDVYRNTGKCPYGASCTFAHNDQEKRKDISTVYKFKTEMCRDWESGRVCSFGAGCHYAHGVHELGNATTGPEESLESLLML